MQKPIIVPWVPAAAAALVLMGGVWALRCSPDLENEVFTRGAASLAGLFLGVSGFRMEAGWALPFEPQPLLVTTACAATDFFIMAATLLGWHLMRRTNRLAWLPAILVLSLVVAVPITLFVNALRIVAVGHAHLWLISRVPPSYEAFLHLLTGASVFLLALISLNLVLEIYGRPGSSTRG